MSLFDEINSVFIDTYSEYGVYVISVASRLADMHPNTLRKYERAGLISPERTAGRQRLYSDEDVKRLKLARNLSEIYGLNLQGVNLALEMLDLLVNSAAELERPTAAGRARLVNRIRKFCERLSAEQEQE